MSAGCTVRFTTFVRVVRLLVARTRATTVQYRAQGSGGCSVRPRIGIETHRTPHRTLYVPSGAAVSSVSDSVFSFRPVAAGGAGCWAGEQRPGTAVWRVVRRTASQGNAAKPGGRARRPCLRRTDAPRGTLQWRACADTGCRVSQRLVWTRAQLHYLTKRQQRNVDNETTYKTSAMKQPNNNRNDQASPGRMAETQLSSERCHHALRQHYGQTGR